MSGDEAVSGVKGGMDTSETIYEKIVESNHRRAESSTAPAKETRPRKDGKANGSRTEEVIKIQNNILNAVCYYMLLYVSFVR